MSCLEQLFFSFFLEICVRSTYGEKGVLAKKVLVFFFYILKHFRSRAFEQTPKTNYVDIKEKSCSKKYDGDDDDANCLGRGEVNSSVKTKFPREFGLQ